MAFIFYVCVDLTHFCVWRDKSEGMGVVGRVRGRGGGVVMSREETLVGWGVPRCQLCYCFRLLHWSLPSWFLVMLNCNCRGFPRGKFLTCSIACGMGGEVGNITV